MIDKRDLVIKTDVRRFIPFREGNVLKKLTCDFKVRDRTLRMRATSGFYPLFATITECIFDSSCYKNGFTLYKVATNDGFHLLINNEIDILFSSGPSENQKKAMNESGAEYVFVPLLKEPLAIILNRANPVSNISVEAIRDLYFGDIENWKSLGGNDLKVKTYQLTDGNGSQTCFSHLVKGNKLDDSHIEVETMPGIIDDAADYEGAICYAFWSYYTKMYAHANTKMVRVNGCKVTDSAYPINHEVYMIFKKDNPNKEIERIRDFLISEEGVSLIRKANMVQRDYGEENEAFPS